MKLEIQRKRIPIEIGETIELDHNDLFDTSDESRVLDRSLIPLPFDATAIQVIVISTMRTEEEQAAYEAAVNGAFASMLDAVVLEEDEDL